MTDSLQLHIGDIEVPAWFNPEYAEAYRIAYMHGWARGVADANGEQEEPCE